MRIVLAVLLALGVMNPAAAATYTVSPIGDDAGNGTTRPFRTLERALDAIQDSDTIVLQAGVYAAGGKSARLRQNVTIRGEGNVVLDGAGLPADSNGLNLDRMDGLTLQNLRVLNCPVYGVFVFRSRFVNVVNCEFSFNGKSGLLTQNVSDLLVEDCIAASNQAEHGIYLSCSGDRLTVRHNLLTGNGKAGLQINAVQTENVVAEDPNNDASSEHCMIEANIVTGNGSLGAAAIHLMSVSGSFVINNLVRDNLSGGILLWDDGAGPQYGCVDNRIWHNTVVFTSGLGRYAFKAIAGSTDNELRNNVLVASNSDASAIVTTERLDSDNNCLGGAYIVNGGTLADWRGETRNDNASFEQDPGLDADFHPTPTSLCRDTGALVYPIDLDGSPRPRGAAPDIGCFEEPIGPPVVIYGDALAAGWKATSKHASVSLRVANPVAEGTASIGLTLTAKGGYLRLLGPGVPLPGRTTLKLVINGAKTGKQAFTLQVYVDGALTTRAVYLTAYAGVLPAKQWVEVAIPLADLGATQGSLTGIRVASARAQKRAFIDFIRVE